MKVKERFKAFSHELEIVIENDTTSDSMKFHWTMSVDGGEKIDGLHVNNEDENISTESPFLDLVYEAYMYETSKDVNDFIAKYKLNENREMEKIGTHMYDTMGKNASGCTTTLREKR